MSSPCTSYYCCSALPGTAGSGAPMPLPGPAQRDRRPSARSERAPRPTRLTPAPEPPAAATRHSDPAATPPSARPAPQTPAADPNPPHGSWSPDATPPRTSPQHRPTPCRDDQSDARRPTDAPTRATPSAVPEPKATAESGRWKQPARNPRVRSRCASRGPNRNGADTKLRTPNTRSGSDGSPARATEAGGTPDHTTGAPLVSATRTPTTPPL